MSFNPIAEAMDQMGKEMLVVDKEQVLVNIAKILMKLFRPDLDRAFEDLHSISQEMWLDKARWVYAEVKKSR